MYNAHVIKIHFSERIRTIEIWEDARQIMDDASRLNDSRLEAAILKELVYKMGSEYKDWGALLPLNFLN